MTARSSLVLEGDVTFSGRVQLDGALVIKAVAGKMHTLRRDVYTQTRCIYIDEIPTDEIPTDISSIAHPQDILGVSRHRCVYRGGEHTQMSRHRCVSPGGEHTQMCISWG